MKTRFLIILCLALSALAFAQPQAPITWGDVRLLQEVPYLPYAAADVACHGDTIVLTAAYIDTGGSLEYYPAASVSGDNGQTWSPWRVLGPVPRYIGTYAHSVGFSSQGIFCTAQTSSPYWGFFVTTDLGNTWQYPPDSLFILRYYTQRGDTLFCKTTSYGVTWTADLGHTFAPVRWITDFEVPISDLAASRSTIHALSVNGWLRYARAPLLQGPFETSRILNDFVYYTVAAFIVFDDNATGMISSAVDYTPPPFNGEAIWLNTSNDDGITWSLPDTITPFESSGDGGNDIKRYEHLWLVHWGDSTRQAEFEGGGAWCRFSANDGRSWYPNQQVEGSADGRGTIGDVDLRSGRVRLYLYLHTGGTQHISNYYYQIEGQIHTDSLPPAFFAASQLAPLLPGDTTVDLSVTAADNDSLWQMVMVLRRQGEADSTVISLARSASHSYQAQWCVPTDSADWLYYYRAEDMWENVSFYPPDGPASPWTFHVGPLSSADEVILHPSSFSLSVYPNPANSSVILSGTLPPDNKPVSLFVYDLLGREVSRLMIPHTGSNAFHVPWNLTDSDGRPLTTGLYFLVTLPHAVSTKLMVIR